MYIVAIKRKRQLIHVSGVNEKLSIRGYFFFLSLVCLRRCYNSSVDAFSFFVPFFCVHMWVGVCVDMVAKILLLELHGKKKKSFACLQVYGFTINDYLSYYTYTNIYYNLVIYCHHLSRSSLF